MGCGDCLRSLLVVSGAGGWLAWSCEGHIRIRPVLVGLDCSLRLGHLQRRCLLWLLRSADGALQLAEFAHNSATFGCPVGIVVRGTG